MISSLSGALPLNDRSAYCAAKHATNAFFLTLALEEEDIRMTIVCPDSFSGSNFRKNSLL